jgi:hypothetical protein
MATRQVLARGLACVQPNQATNPDRPAMKGDGLPTVIEDVNVLESDEQLHVHVLKYLSESEEAQAMYPSAP